MRSERTKGYETMNTFGIVLRLGDHATTHAFYITLRIERSLSW